MRTDRVSFPGMAIRFGGFASKDTALPARLRNIGGGLRRSPTRRARVAGALGSRRLALWSSTFRI